MGIADFLSSIFGNKSQRDLKEITPYVNKINSMFAEFSNLSNDELREKTKQIQAKILQSVDEENSKIVKIKEKIAETAIENREVYWNEIDKIEKIITEKLEKELDESLPEVFCIVKETARRLSENTELKVKATPMDIALAANDKNDFLSIDDEGNAIYYNTWTAGGNEITWNMVHYDVQLFGGVVLNKGKIAEMATGEGKTLVGTLPIFLNALTKRGVHVVTVNDYLSKRDSEWMGPLFMFHGLSVDCIDKHEPNSEQRKNAYKCDITYGTNNEFGFDYLRDNMAVNQSDLVQRKHNFAIVDEVDSVLIDDARTPLIIAGPVPKGGDQLFKEFKPRVEMLFRAQRDLCTRLLAEAKQKLTSSDKQVAEEGAKLLFRSFKGLPKSKPLIKFLSEEGVKTILIKTEEYYMSEQNKHMPEVTDDLYFVLDEKNNSVELTEKGIDRLTGHSDDPNFFILPDIGAQLSELEGSNKTDEEKASEKDEIMQNYSVKAERIHTINQLLKAYALFEIDDQYVVIDNKVMIVDEQTGRIMDGRRYSDGLHQAIEAKENVKIEEATQTFATITLQNYFRMYNKLAGMTGTAETEAGELWDIYKLDVVVIPTNKPIARNDKNDRIYKTKREKYIAIIEEVQQLVEEGRAVLVGTTSVEISELLSKMLQMRKIPHNVLNAKMHQKEADIVALAGQKGTVTIATNMAGRGTDIKLAQEVKAAGGLAILGTERHESRRVDRQLRGRAGRQGDPGSSVFFISLEDNLMRLFASDKIAGMMDKMGFKEGEMLEHNMLSKSVERAQKKVEENNFGIRKRLLEYDDVMNSQREVIYKRRRNALMGERLGMDIVNMFYDVASNLVDTHVQARNYEDFKIDVMRIFALECPIDLESFESKKILDLTDELFDFALEKYKSRKDKLAETANPVIKQVFEKQGDRFENIVVPITDGKRMYNISCNLKEAYESDSKTIVASFEKSIILHAIDDLWKEHLREMDDLRQSVQNASYEQKDPLLIYKFESFDLFRGMINRINEQSVKVLMRGKIPMHEPEDVKESKVEEKTDYSKYSTEKEETNEPKSVKRPVEAQQKNVTAPIQVEKTPGRNEPCYCGSGKKFKQCHGKN